MSACTIQQKVEQFVASNFTCDAISGVMLTGSAATNSRTFVSDVDVIILLPIINAAFTENFFEDGFEIHLIFLPENNLLQVIERDIFLCEGNYLSMFFKGIMLYDKRGLLEQVKKYATEFFSTEMEVQSKERSNLLMRAKITSELHDFINTRDAHKQYYSGAELFKLLSQYELLLSGYATHIRFGKSLAQDLNRVGSKPTEIINCFKEYSNRSNIEPLVSLAQNMLSSSGGLLNKYTTGYEYNRVESDFAMIYLPNHCVQEQNIIEVIKDLAANLQSTVHYIFYCKCAFMEDGIYMPIFAPREDINEWILSLTVNLLAKYQKEGIRLRFPYQTSYFDALALGGTTTLKQLAPYYAAFSSFVINKLTRKSSDWNKSKINNGIYMLIAFGINAQYNQNAYKTICFKLFEKLLPNASNPMTITNISQVKLLYEDKQSEYARLFESQKQQVNYFFGAAIRSWDNESLPDAEIDLQIGMLQQLIKIDKNKNYKNVSHSLSEIIDTEHIYIEILNQLLSMLLLDENEKAYTTFIVYKLIASCDS
ncbi:MAG: hypothetical protein LBK47_01220 [Prevotellaceae bacterium]|nr:hypothetical protein [Prevotellaceae bacterium]